MLTNFQSKKGGLAAWEPAGAQEWLEVSLYYGLFNQLYKINHKI